MENNLKEKEFPLPIYSCPDCLRKYIACKTCGHCEYTLKTGKKCPKCSVGILEYKESLICCKRYWHHLGSTCKHCGMEG